MFDNFSNCFYQIQQDFKQLYGDETATKLSQDWPTIARDINRVAEKLDATDKKNAAALNVLNGNRNLTPGIVRFIMENLSITNLDVLHV